MPSAPFRTSQLLRAASLSVATLAATTAFATSAQAAGDTAWSVVFNDGPATATQPLPDYAYFYKIGADFAGPSFVGTVTRNGAEIGRSDASFGGPSGNVELGDLRAGDVLHVIDRATGAEQLQVPFDGQPSFGPEVCAGATSATGGRTAGSIVEQAGSYSVAGSANYSGSKPNEGTVTGGSGPGSSFSMTLAAPLALGEMLYAYSNYDLPGDIHASNYVSRLVAACPVPVVATPPVVVAPAADKTAPKGVSEAGKGFKKLDLGDLAKKGFKFTIKTDEAATLKGTITLKTTSGKGKKKKTKLVVVGSTTQALAAGQSTEVKLKTAQGTKGKLKKAAKAKGSKLVVGLTLTDAAGNVTTLPGTTVSVPKK